MRREWISLRWPNPDCIPPPIEHTATRVLIHCYQSSYTLLLEFLCTATRVLIHCYQSCSLLPEFLCIATRVLIHLLPEFFTATRVLMHCYQSSHALLPEFLCTATRVLIHCYQSSYYFITYQCRTVSCNKKKKW